MKLIEIYSDLVEKYFPKGKCMERGQALVLVAELNIAFKQWIKDTLPPISGYSPEVTKILRGYREQVFINLRLPDRETEPHKKKGVRDEKHRTRFKD